MRRSSERLIDVAVLIVLLGFAWLMRVEQPGLAGVVLAASISFWLQKNATEPSVEDQIAKTAAKAAAEALLRTEAREAKSEDEPRAVEIVGQSDAVEVFDSPDRSRRHD